MITFKGQDIGAAGFSQHHLVGIVWTKKLLHWTIQVLESKLSFLCLVSGARSATVTCSSIYMEASDGPREGPVTRCVGFTDFPKIIYIDISSRCHKPMLGSVRPSVFKSIVLRASIYQYLPPLVAFDDHAIRAGKSPIIPE
eukprot:g50804.t1